MANYKRKKPRTQIRCNLCTDNRVGNSKITSNKGRLLIWLKDKEFKKDLRKGLE